MILGGEDLASSVVGLEVSKSDSCVWVVFDEVIMQSGAPYLGQSLVLLKGLLEMFLRGLMA